MMITITSIVYKLSRDKDIHFHRNQFQLDNGFLTKSLTMLELSRRHFQYPFRGVIKLSGVTFRDMGIRSQGRHLGWWWWLTVDWKVVGWRETKKVTKGWASEGLPLLKQAEMTSLFGPTGYSLNMLVLKFWIKRLSLVKKVDNQLEFWVINLEFI